MPIRKDLRHFYRTPAWYAAREAVKLRAKDRCESCGAKNGSKVWIYGWPGHESTIQCGCAHVNGIAGDDRIDENLRWWCRGCHLRHELVTAFVASGSEQANSLPPSIAQMSRLEMLSVIWTTRPCFICEKATPCEHREAEADLAEIDRLLIQPLKRPVQSAQIAATVERKKA